MLGKGVNALAIAAAIVAGAAPAAGKSIADAIRRGFAPETNVGHKRTSGMGYRKKPGWTNARYRRHSLKLRNRARHRRACRG